MTADDRMAALESQQQTTAELHARFQAQVDLVLRRLVEDQERLSKLVVEGNGRDSIAVRLDRVEHRAAALGDDIAALRGDVHELAERSAKRTWQMLWIVLGWAVAGVAAAIGWSLRSNG